MAEDFLEYRQELAASFHPRFEAFNSLVKEGLLGGVGSEGIGFFKLLEFGFSAIEMGANLFANESANETFEINGGFVICPAVLHVLGFAKSAKGFQSSQALAGRAFGDAEFLNEVIERERLG